MKIFSVTLLFLIFLLQSIAFAGEWRVTPIRLDLGRDAKSGAITVINEGEKNLHVQMKAFEWSQDMEGKDQYTETEEILFFPKMMVVEKKEERILRVGIKIPAAAKEKTYRLFIEETPEPKKGEGAQVAIAVRFGIPVFVKPVAVEAKGDIEKIEISKGVVNTLVKNSGNRHFIINSIILKGTNIKGEETYSKEISGWYLLSGTSRLYTAQFPQEACNNTAKLDIEVRTSEFVLNGKLDVDRLMCTP